MKHKLFVRILCIILAVAMVASVGLIAASTFNLDAASISVSAGAEGFVNDDYVNLRSGAGTNYSVKACMKKNTEFTFVDGKVYNSDWYKIKLSNGTVGYIYSKYIGVHDTGIKGYVNDDYVNLRKGAGTSYGVVICMRKNTKFTYVDEKLYNSEWYKIKLDNGTVGYIHKKYASILNTGTSTDKTVTGYINTDYVNLRSGAGTSYSIKTCMRINTAVTFLSTDVYNSSWYNVKLNNGTTGYVYTKYVTVNNKENSPSDNNDTVVSKPSQSTLTLSASSQTIYVGNKFAITAKGADSVSWTSSNSSVASVDSNGVVTAKKSGSATIKATSGKKTASCTITVKSGNSINISATSVDIPSKKSVILKSTTAGVQWKSSDTSIATVKNGIVDTKAGGYVTISAYNSYGAATCLVKVGEPDNVKFTYVSPNSPTLNSTVNFKAITDKNRDSVRFIVSNGSTSYTVYANKKEADGDNYIWTASKKLDKAGKWTVKAYSKHKNSDEFLTTENSGTTDALVSTLSSNKTTICEERRASDEIIDIIANYEGFLSTVTPDSITGEPTLGYGKVVFTNEQFYHNLSKIEAYAYLTQTVNKGGYTTRANKFLLDNGIKFNQQQFDALVCFLYNNGIYTLTNDSELQYALLNTGSGVTTSTIKAGASGYVNSSYVNLRSGAGTGYSVVKCMSYDTKFTFVDGKLYNSDWYKIKLSDGTTGYVYRTYASSSVVSSGRDLNAVDKQYFLNKFLQYHHSSGSCYKGLLYRRIDEAEIFFYGDYKRDGEYNKYNFNFTCQKNWAFGV